MNAKLCQEDSSSSSGPLAVKAAKPRVAVLFYRLGPYHVARLKAACAGLEVAAVEFSSVDPTYAWNEVRGQDRFERRMLFSGTPVAAQPAVRIFRTVDATLDELRPDAVAIPGWYDRCSLAALRWCARRHVPVVLMSETTAWDEARKPWRELVKRRVVRFCGAGLVGGRSHAEYLEQLGMPGGRIFVGYDVVDNGYFENRAAEVRNQRSVVREKHGLPEKYFLASARFIEKKNLPRLLQAFARYRTLCEARGPKDDKTTGQQDQRSVVSGPVVSGPVVPWSLVLLGDGPLRSSIFHLRSSLGLDACVHLPGFKQYEELPVYYGLASAFVHASTTEQWGLVVNEAMASGLPVLVSNRCGCARDLVQEGHNGFTFDPADTEQLARLMCRLSAPDTDLARMGDVSRELARNWDASAFGEGLSKAVATALAVASDKATLLDRVFLESLVHGVRALRPIDERVAAGPAREKRGQDEPEYLVFSFQGKRVLAVPSEPRKIRRVALSRYQPYTPKRQLYAMLLRTAMMLRCERFIASAGPIPRDEELGITSSGWLNRLLAELHLQLDGSWEHAILAWPSQTTRGRLYLHLLARDLTPFAFVKVGLRSTDDTGLQNGLESLLQLACLPLKRIRLPRVVGSGQFDSVMYTVLEPLPMGARPARFPRNYDPSALLAEFSSPTHRLTSDGITRLSWWSRYTKKLQAQHQAFHSALLQLLPLGAEVCRVHGDMGLSNMVLAGDKVWLFDWENSHPSGPAMTDRVGYFLSFAVGKTASRPGKCLRDFRRRFSGETSPQQRLDLMLALAFRFASGLPDAELYIGNWPTLLPAASE